MLLCRDTDTDTGIQGSPLLSVVPEGTQWLWPPGSPLKLQVSLEQPLGRCEVVAEGNMKPGQEAPSGSWGTEKRTA